VDAVFFCNDDLAQGGLLAAQRLGLAVPQRLAVAGFNDLAGSDQMVPALTTVSINPQRMGQQAAQLLFKQINAGRAEPGAVRTTARLVVRGSTAAPAVRQRRAVS